MEAAVGYLVKGRMNIYKAVGGIVPCGIAFQICGKGPGRVFIKGPLGEILHEEEDLPFMESRRTYDPGVVVYLLPLLVGEPYTKDIFPAVLYQVLYMEGGFHTVLIFLVIKDLRILYKARSIQGTDLIGHFP